MRLLEDGVSLTDDDGHEEDAALPHGGVPQQLDGEGGQAAQHRAQHPAQVPPRPLVGEVGQEGAEEAGEYSTVQYSSVQYSTVQYSTVQCSTMRCSAIHMMLLPLGRALDVPLLPAALTPGQERGLVLAEPRPGHIIIVVIIRIIMIAALVACPQSS